MFINFCIEKYDKYMYNVWHDGIFLREGNSMNKAERLGRDHTKKKILALILTFALAFAFIPPTAAPEPAQASGEMLFVVTSARSIAHLVHNISEELITVIDVGSTDPLEYSTNGTTWRDISGGVLSLSNLIPSATAAGDVTLSIRFKAVVSPATPTSPASEATHITLPRRQVAPTSADVRFNGFTEEIATVSSLMEYRIGTTGTFTSINGGTIPVDVATSTSQTFQIRMAPTTSGTPTSASATLNITVPARAAAPNAVYNGSLDAITGVTTAMEYSLNGGANWIRSTATSIPRSAIGNVAATVQVRRAATATTSASQIRVVYVPDASSTGSVPAINYISASETVTGVSSLMEYSTNGTSWTAIRDNMLIGSPPDTISVSNLIPSATAAGDVTLRVRSRSTGSGATAVPASEQATVILPRRQAAPRAADVRFDGVSETIATVSSAMEYRIGSTGTFRSINAVIMTVDVATSTSQTFQIRMAATTSGTPTSASATLNITVPARAAAPNAVYNGSLDAITGVTTAMEYSLNGVANWIRSTATSIPRSVFASASTVMVRIAATSARPHSNVREITIPGAPGSAPGSISLNITDETVTGVSGDMEYSTNGTTWRAMSGNTLYNAQAGTLNVSSLIPSATASGNITLRVRVRATSSSMAASEQTPIILPRRQATPRAADVKFNGAADRIDIVFASGTSVMEYRFGTSGTFASITVSGTSTSIPANAGAASQRFQIRVAAESPDLPASAVLSITIPARAAAPNAVYNGALDAITGVTTAMEYSVNSGAWVRSTATSIPRSLIGSDAAATVRVRRAATATAPASSIREISVPPKPSPGAAPTGLVYNTTSETVTGVTNLMEYSTNGTSWKAINGNTLSVSSLIPSATSNINSVVLSIRFRATGSGSAATPPSQPATPITLYRRQATPRASDVRFNGLAGNDGAGAIIGVSASMEYRIGTTDNFTTGTGVNIPITAGTSQRFQVRARATSDSSASAILNITVPARASAPNAVYNGSFDAITGVSTARQYSLNGGTSWNTCTGSIISRAVFGNSAATVMVRTAATATRPASNIREVSVPAAPAASPAGLTLDLINEVINGISSGLEYSTNGTSWKPISGDPWNISSLIPSATSGNDVTLRIRTRGTSSAAASQAAPIALPRRQATPRAADVKFDALAGPNDAGAITGVTNLMEFRIGTSGTFDPVTGATIPVAPGTSSQRYQIRVAATTTAPASVILNVTVPARASAPNAVYNSSTDMITGVSTAREYSLDGTNWNRCISTTIPRSAFGSAATVQVRTAATATRPASNIRSVSIPTAPGSAPGGIIFNSSDETVTGVSNLMEYSTNGTSWKPITGSTLDVSSLIPAATRADVTLIIRTRATDTAAASQRTTVTLPKRQDAPTAASVRYNGQTETVNITGITGLEYRIGTTGTFTSISTPSVDAIAGNASQRFQIRVEATSTAPASAVLNITIPARAAAPSAVYNGSTGDVNRVTRAMEYRLDGGATWNECTGTTIPSAVLGSAAKVEIRTAATAARPASRITEITVPVGSGPGIITNP